MSFERHCNLFCKIYDTHRELHSRRRCSAQFAEEYSLLHRALYDRVNLDEIGIAALACNLHGLIVGIKKCSATHINGNGMRRLHSNCVKFLASNESYTLPLSPFPMQMICGLYSKSVVIEKRIAPSVHDAAPSVHDAAPSD
jgi:hypothetical protein